MHRRKVYFTGLVAVLALLSPARAESPALMKLMESFKTYATRVAGSAETDPHSLGSFMKQNPECSSFTDGCSVCLLTDHGLMCTPPVMICIRRPYACGDLSSVAIPGGN